MPTFKRKGARTSVIYEAVQREVFNSPPPSWRQGMHSPWLGIAIGEWIVRLPDGGTAIYDDKAFRSLFQPYTSAPNT